MTLPNKIRNFNAFVDGFSFAGIVTTGKLPALNLKTEDHQGGGMDGPVAIDMGTEGMTAELNFGEWVPRSIELIGTSSARLVLRPARVDEETTQGPIIATLGGLWKGWEPNELKASSDVPMKLTCAVRYYRLEMDGRELFEIDIPNAVRRIGGKDQLAAMRRAMGL
jgi:P2 family phage contractile tail tube protein